MIAPFDDSLHVNWVMNSFNVNCRTVGIRETDKKIRKLPLIEGPLYFSFSLVFKLQIKTIVNRWFAKTLKYVYNVAFVKCSISTVFFNETVSLSLSLSVALETKLNQQSESFLQSEEKCCSLRRNVSNYRDLSDSMTSENNRFINSLFHL